MNAEEQLGALQKKWQKLSEDKARAEARVEGARKAQQEALAKLAKLGITDPLVIPAKLVEFQQQATSLAQEIDSGIPDRYRV